MSLPSSYIDASWRVTSAKFDPVRDRVGFGLDLADGTVVRFALDRKSALDLRETLAEALFGDHPSVVAHSESSSGKSSNDGSPQEGQMPCPPTRSSSAAAAE
jgi:hypothetical protein